MKRKKELHEEFKMLEKELKALSEIVQNDATVPNEDEIHGWAIQMDQLILDMERLKEEAMEFFTN